jgi:signal transduction histidine kinase
MLHRISQTTNTGSSQRLWPVFALLIAVVVLPTAGVFWFMNQAMQNEQFAVRQRLTTIYNAQLHAVAGKVQSAWTDKVLRITQAQQRAKAPEAFARLVKSGIVDSVLYYEKGRLRYPDLTVPPAVTLEIKTQLWTEGRSLEYQKNDPKAAAEIYGKIARQSGNAREAAAALSAQARCLSKAGQTKAAVELLTRMLGAVRYRDAADAQGRLIFPNALMFALELMQKPSHPLFPKTAALLAERLNDYSGPALPSSQRRFLMKQLQSLWPDCPPFPTLAAEEMAAVFSRAASMRVTPGQVRWTAFPSQRLWAYQTAEESLIALFLDDHLLKFMNAAANASKDAVPGIRYRVLGPGAATEEALWQRDISEAFPSWKLELKPEGPDPFESATNQRITRYIWTGVLMTVGILVLSILMAGYLRRQIRLTRLKNDLIATVSHELKTPLASMRLLVDTLRDGHYQDTKLVQEYLHMIAKENARLSSLIEEFLTFSRMERNKARFDRSILRTDEIVHAALESVGDRLHAPNCSLQLELAPELPDIMGDRDALVTVLVNLLDNALKYSGDEKKIRLRSFASNGHVFLEVQDNGVGFSRSAAKKIFNRFYQVDQTLSRRAGGCGLGLSIVQFIVTAHNGSVIAKSQPGRGSTFTVQLPAA